MAEQRRVAKLEKAIQQEVARALVSRVTDPRARGVVTITRATLSTDLTVARVYFSVLGSLGKRRAAERFFREATGMFRTLVAKRLDLRTAPHVVFHFDEQLEKEIRISELIDKAVADDRQAAAKRAGGPDEQSDRDGESGEEE